MRKQCWSILLFAFIISISCNENNLKSPLATLKNEHLKVTVKKTGAEIISILLLEDNTEYLWQGDSITWSDHAIVQFPIIGNLKDNRYQYKDSYYEMMSHGFSRISEFYIKEQSDTQIIYELKNNKLTEPLYPFKFIFHIVYSLEGKSIKIDFKVSNPSEEEMYFSLGYHPGFNCPLKIGESMSDYFLEFSEVEHVDRLLMKDNLIDSIQSNYLSDTNKIQLDKSLFQEDAIILKNIKSTSLALKNHINEKSVTMTFGQVPYLGIWSPKKFGDFVCIEPWHGIPDRREASQKLQEKEGIIELKPNESFNWDCKITIN